MLELRAARIAMDFVTQAIAYDPDAAIGRAGAIELVPAVVEEAIFAGSPIVTDVSWCRDIPGSPHAQAMTFSG